MAYDEHKRAADTTAVRCAVVTLSDTRTETSDASGQRIRDLLRHRNHTVARYAIIPDEPARLSALLDELLNDPTIDAILTNGGTGVSPRDHTIAVVETRLTVPLPGFGELFRMLSYEQVQSGAMLSRATGGVANGKLLFALPGSTPAVELAMTKLILPELGHLLREMHK